MPHTDYMPHANAALRTWARSFAEGLATAPGDYGVTAAEAASLAALVAEFDEACQQTYDPITRTPVAIVNRNGIRKRLMAECRRLARIIHAHPGMTDARRASVGLPPRNNPPSRIAPPATAPALILHTMGGRRARLLIRDPQTPTRRGRPRSAVGAQLFMAFGPAGLFEPPSERQYAFVGVATRHWHTLEFPPERVGQTAWVIARWVNARGEAGPPSVPACATVAG